MSLSSKPHVILIMTDQQRADTIRAHGYDYMITPNLDRLANEGVSFRNTFSCGATCVPSRAAMFTGMYPHNTGVYGFQSWAHHRSWVDDLAENGYHCVNIGKMHIDPRDAKTGFHERLIVENPTSDFLKNGGTDDEWGKYLSLHNEQRPLDRHLTDPDWYDKYQAASWNLEEHLHSDVFIGNSVLAWIRRHKPNKPVFLQIGFTGPHEPYDPLPRHLEMYQDQPVPAAKWREDELDHKPPQHRAHQYFNSVYNHESTILMSEASDERVAQMRRHYYANITTVDEKIGEIIDLLGEKGYLDNALVIFTSDHGDMLGDHRLPYKWLMYDAVVKVPLIISDSRRRVRTEYNNMVSLIDIGPTILDAAGIGVPSYLEGTSLLGYLGSVPPSGERDYVFSEDNYQVMIRSHLYKLVHYIGQEQDGELYDLKNDPDELVNLYHHKLYEDVKMELRLAMFHWVLRSNYSTANYKNKDKYSKMLWPEDTKYLHPEVIWNPGKWKRDGEQ